MAVVVEQPRPAHGLDAWPARRPGRRSPRGRAASARRGSGSRRAARAAPPPAPGRRTLVRGHEEVAVAVLVAGAEREGTLDIGADQVVAEDPLPLADQLVEQRVERGVRRRRSPGDGRRCDARDVSHLPLPRDLEAPVGALVPELAEHLGERGVVEICVGLLTGDDRADHRRRDALLHRRGLRRGLAEVLSRAVEGLLGAHLGRPRAAVRLGRVGRAARGGRAGRRALATGRDVPEGLDQAGLGEAGPRAAVLAVEGELPRVRVQALRTLGAVGDTEHVEVVQGPPRRRRPRRTPSGRPVAGAARPAARRQRRRLGDSSDPRARSGSAAHPSARPRPCRPRAPLRG